MGQKKEKQLSVAQPHMGTELSWWAMQIKNKSIEFARAIRNVSRAKQMFKCADAKVLKDAFSTLNVLRLDRINEYFATLVPEFGPFRALNFHLGCNIWLNFHTTNVCLLISDSHYFILICLRYTPLSKRSFSSPHVRLTKPINTIEFIRTPYV